jgi:hypothetical protein
LTTQGCDSTVVRIMIVSDLLEEPCNKSDNINKVVTSCLQLVPNLLTTWDKQCQHNLLLADLLQDVKCEIFPCVDGCPWIHLIWNVIFKNHVFRKWFKITVTEDIVTSDQYLPVCPRTLKSVVTLGSTTKTWPSFEAVIKTWPNLSKLKERKLSSKILWLLDPCGFLEVICLRAFRKFVWPVLVGGPVLVGAILRSIYVNLCPVYVNLSTEKMDIEKSAGTIWL